MKLIFASNNDHKAEEIRSVLKNKFEILTLKEAGINIDIPEPYDTLEENAAEKAGVIYQMTATSCFSEDTGLEVVALNGEPGVKAPDMQGITGPSRTILINCSPTWIKAPTGGHVSEP